MADYWRRTQQADQEKLPDPRFGRVTISPCDPVIAGSSNSWRFTYTVGPAGMNPGDALQMRVPYGFSPPRIHPAGWPPPIDHPNQGPDPIAPGYLELTYCPHSSRIVMFHVEHFSKKGWMSAWYAKRTVRFALKNKPLRQGERIEIIFGGLRSGSPGATAPVIAQRFSFPFGFLKAGDSEPLPVASPELEILPAAPHFATLAAPSIAAPQEKLAIRGTLRDIYGNPTRSALQLAAKRLKTSSEIESDRLEIEGSRFEVSAPAPDSPGVVRQVVSFNKPQIHDAQTNPILVEESPKLHLFWGDIHGHTGLADGMGTLEEYFAYAKDFAHLDFSSLGEHDFALGGEYWQAAKEVTSKFNEAGRFVTLYGYEWSGEHHVNVYYKNDSGPIFHSAPEESNTVEKLLRLLPREDVLVIPHQHFGTDWKEFDPELIPLTEIYSEHGSSEFKGCKLCLPTSTVNDDAYVNVALEMGHRIGFIGSSDSHSGRPGYSAWIRSRRQYHGGLAACFARELTRDSIWDSLRSRRCYATSGERIFLRFHLNDALMGEETEAAKGEGVKIRIQVCGTAELRCVELVRNGEVIRTWRNPGWELVEEFEGELTASSYYYVRVEQADDHMAWSSPIWVDVAG